MQPDLERLALAAAQIRHRYGETFGSKRVKAMAIDIETVKAVISALLPPSEGLTQAMIDAGPIGCCCMDAKDATAALAALAEYLGDQQ